MSLQMRLQTANSHNCSLQPNVQRVTNTRLFIAGLCCCCFFPTVNHHTSLLPPTSAIFESQRCERRQAERQEITRWSGRSAAAAASVLLTYWHPSRYVWEPEPGFRWHLHHISPWMITDWHSYKSNIKLQAHSISFINATFKTIQRGLTVINN